MSHTLSIGARSAPSIGDVAARLLQKKLVSADRVRRPGARHRTGAPVPRGSLEEGSFEDTFFVELPTKDLNQLLFAARKALDEGCRLKRLARTGERVLSVAERNLAALTAGTIRVLEELCAFARTCKGRVYPSYEALAERTHRGRATVARALSVLEQIGLLVRQRRFKCVEKAGQKRYEQTSSAYRLKLSKVVMQLLPRSLRPPPLPVDQEQREAERQEDMTIMLAGLSCRELARTTLGDTALGRMVARLGAGVDAREASINMRSNC